LFEFGVRAGWQRNNRGTTEKKDRKREEERGTTFHTKVREGENVESETLEEGRMALWEIFRTLSDGGKKGRSMAGTG